MQTQLLFIVLQDDSTQPITSCQISQTKSAMTHCTASMMISRIFSTRKKIICKKTVANSHHYLFLFQKEDRWGGGGGGGAGGQRRVKTNQHKLVHKKCEKIHTNFQNKLAKPQEAVEMHGFINWFRRKPTTNNNTQVHKHVKNIR